MKIFTKRLWQFAGCALIATVVMYLAFYFVYNGSVSRDITISTLYFCSMYALGRHFGKMDSVEHNIYDIGIRWHAVTFFVCVGFHYLYTFFLYTFVFSKLFTTNAKVVLNVYNNNAILTWGLILLVHFIIFLCTRKNAIKGYNKEEIFE